MKKQDSAFSTLMSKLCRTKRYIGKCVAVIGDKLVVAVGKDRYDAFKKARKKYPTEELGVYYVPKAEEALTVLCSFLTLK